MRLKTLFAYAAALIFLSIAGVADADNFPDKPIRPAVPFLLDDNTDILARAIGAEINKSPGQPALINHRLGAGGNIGYEFVAKPPGNGSTLLMDTSGARSISQSPYIKLPYDPVKDFVPFTVVPSGPNALVIKAAPNDKNKLTDIKSSLVYVRTNPGCLDMASSGKGTSIHLAGELFKTQTNTFMGRTPYRGYEASSRFGILAPSGTPADIVKKPQQEIAKSLTVPAVKERLISQGADPVGNTPVQFAALTQSETQKWAKLVKASGAKEG